MSTKIATLSKKRDFDLVTKYGRWANGQFLDLKYLELAKIKDYYPKNENPETFVKQLRLAIVAGVKLSKKAVERNRAKRLAREAVRSASEGMVAQGGFYVLVMPKKNILDKSLAEIRQETKVLMRRIGVFVPAK